MTDKEIIKALECCKKDDCDNCHNDFGNCYANLAGYAFDLINRQQAEIANLEIELKAMRGAANSYKMHYENAKSETIKEFAERLKKYFSANHSPLLSSIMADKIDSLVKEMTEVQQ